MPKSTSFAAGSACQCGSDHQRLANNVTLISRSDRRPRAERIAWSLRQRLPTIPISLANRDADIPLDLQTVLDTVYDCAVYRHMLKYHIPLQPPPDENAKLWLAQQLAAKNIAATQTPEPRA